MHQRYASHYVRKRFSTLIITDFFAQRVSFTADSADRSRTPLSVHEVEQQMCALLHFHNMQFGTVVEIAEVIIEIMKMHYMLI